MSCSISGASTAAHRNRSPRCRRGSARAGRPWASRSGRANHVWNTFDAHRMLYWAGLEGRAVELKRELLQAYHGEGRNPGATDVLVELAGKVGLDPVRAKAIVESRRIRAGGARAGALLAATRRERRSAACVVNNAYGIEGAQPPRGFRAGAAADRVGQGGLTARLVGDVALQVVEPRPGIAVRWCTPIPARRERSARHNLRRIRQRRALELAGLEEAREEYTQPLLDLCQRVRVFQGLRKCGRPLRRGRVAPCMPREERDLRGAHAEARDVVQVEILELRTDRSPLCVLWMRPGVGRHQPRRDLRIEDRLQRGRSARIEPAPEFITQRTRYCTSVLATDPFTL